MEFTAAAKEDDTGEMHNMHYLHEGTFVFKKVLEHCSRQSTLLRKTFMHRHVI